MLMPAGEQQPQLHLCISVVMRTLSEGERNAEAFFRRDCYRIQTGFEQECQTREHTTGTPPNGPTLLVAQCYKKQTNNGRGKANGNGNTNGNSNSKRGVSNTLTMNKHRTAHGLVTYVNTFRTPLPGPDVAIVAASITEPTFPTTSDASVICCRALLATAVAAGSVVTSASEATASGRDMTNLNIELLNSEDRKPPF